MRSSRRNSFTSSLPTRAASGRHYGRVTKDDIRAAALRRWDGRARITTDWVNLLHDPELFFPSGDVLVYLREPGQSSRGPAFRVHQEQLKLKGFEAILTKCIDRAPLPGAGPCRTATTCLGCENHSPPSELYMPAPPKADMETLFDHHITTRNFFAWLYNLPLAGRALGTSMVALGDRINFYRVGSKARTGLEVVSFAESQRYLDFRECMDHALAALALAESLHIEDLWVDAFTHCVGLSHHGLQNSIEYAAITDETRSLIEDARLDMDVRTDFVNGSIHTFFEQDASADSLGFSQAAKEHFDRFRSWLHSFYIEQHGFWPPIDFSNAASKRKILAAMYADFRNLYHHLVDSKQASDTINEININGSGGVCTLQNIESFDKRHKFEPLPQKLPMLPVEPDPLAPSFGLQRRKSWNPVTKRRIDRDNRRARRVQALITASNRDWTVMACLLVRRYSEFEAKTVTDTSEMISMVEGRKIRWILIYAILQTLISVMQAPQQVRNTEGLSYSLCCHAPKVMPWHASEPPSPIEPELPKQAMIEPDVDHLQNQIQSQNQYQSNSNSGSASDLLKFTSAIRKSNSRSDLSAAAKKERRKTLPATPTSSSVTKSAPASRSSSLRRFVSRRSSQVPETPLLPKVKPGQFCEIYVQGYGNGLNEVVQDTMSAEAADQLSVPNSPTMTCDPVNTLRVDAFVGDGQNKEPAGTKVADENKDSVDEIPELVPAGSTSVSRESSNASTNTTWSKSSAVTDDAKAKIVDPPSPPLPIRSTARPASRPSSSYSTKGLFEMNKHERVESKDFNKIIDEQGLYQTVHMNTQTWDAMLGMT